MKKLVSSVLAASMVLSLAACRSSASPIRQPPLGCLSSTAATAEAAGEGSGAYTGTPIKIGGIGPVTGGAAVYGQAVKNAEELAVKEINAAGTSLIRSSGTMSMTPSVGAPQQLEGLGACRSWLVLLPHPVHCRCRRTIMTTCL